MNRSTEKNMSTKSLLKLFQQFHIFQGFFIGQNVRTATLKWQFWAIKSQLYTYCPINSRCLKVSTYLFQFRFSEQIYFFSWIFCFFFIPFWHLNWDIHEWRNDDNFRTIYFVGGQISIKYPRRIYFEVVSNKVNRFQKSKKSKLNIKNLQI